MNRETSVACVRESSWPSAEDLQELAWEKYGRDMGRGPRRRLRFRYSLPSDVYEAVVSQYVSEGSCWLDVGGGHAIFPENPGLARRLVSRCTRVVAVDPSDNVHRNEFVHERWQTRLEDYEPDEQFDVATVRMVVEHVDRPEEFVSALSRLVRPGGVVVIFTVNLWSPVSVMSRIVPFGWHHPIKRLFWAGEEEDTFPVQYRMNTRSKLRRLFDQVGFAEHAFARLDDLSVFAGFRHLGHLELMAWRGLRSVGLGYPESCLMGIYQRQPAA